MGMPVVQAPSEGEAQCAYLCQSGKVYSVASQDSDSLMFNSPRLIRNLSITGKRKLPRQNVFVDVKPELIEMKDVLRELGITREQLIILGLLVGTDYNPGIEGIGPKRAIIMVKKEKTLKNVLGKVAWNHDIPAQDIYEFFLNAPANKDVDLKFGSIQPEKIIGMLVDDHEFSKDRVDKVIKTLTDSKQKTLGSWFK
jgi:flap endonuclease-1